MLNLKMMFEFPDVISRYLKEGDGSEGLVMACKIKQHFRVLKRALTRDDSCLLVREPENLHI